MRGSDASNSERTKHKLFTSWPVNMCKNLGSFSKLDM